MSKSWFPFYGGDFLKATMDLTPEEIGCYVLLLIHYYQHGGLPESSKNLAVITKCSGRKWRAIAQALAPKFESGWVNTRAEKELIKQQEIAAKRQKAGRGGGLAAQAKLRKQMLKQMGTQPQPYRLSSSESPEAPKSGLSISDELKDLLAKKPH